MTLRPLRNVVLFQFMDDTSGSRGRFSERTTGSIIIPVLDSTQHKTNRWGRVVAVGPEVDGVEPGDFVLIEALQWTRGTVLEEQKLWKTDDTKILAVTNDEQVTVQF